MAGASVYKVNRPDLYFTGILKMAQNLYMDLKTDQILEPCSTLTGTLMSSHGLCRPPQAEEAFLIMFSEQARFNRLNF